MSSPLLSQLELVDASIPETATFGEAAAVLCSSGLSAIAVLDAGRKVVGFFTEDALLRGFFPAYLDHLRHTAFLPETVAALATRAQEVQTEPVRRHLSKPVAIERRDSAAHVAERFLHCEWGALAVLDGGRFIGMIRQIDFCRALLARVGSARS